VFAVSEQWQFAMPTGLLSRRSPYLRNGSSPCRHLTSASLLFDVTAFAVCIQTKNQPLVSKLPAAGFSFARAWLTASRILCTCGKDFVKRESKIVYISYCEINIASVYLLLSGGESRDYGTT